MIEASVFILAKNSEKTIQRALDSVKFFKDIAVFDGGSSDETAVLVQQSGARLLLQPREYLSAEGAIKNFGALRNACLKELRYPWVFYLDSDEYLSAEGSAEIAEIVKSGSPQFFIWKSPRKYVIDGKTIDCAPSYPNFQVRFFQRGHARGFIKEVHERVEPLPGEKIGALGYPIFVPLPPVSESRKKFKFYLEIERERLKKIPRGKIFKGAKHILKGMILQTSRIPRVLFCRGNRMPLGYFWAGQEYNLRIVGICLRELIKIKKRP